MSAIEQNGYKKNRIFLDNDIESLLNETRNKALTNTITINEKMKYILISVIILVVQNCYSQTNDSIKNYDLKEVVVTAFCSKQWTDRSSPI